jgi:hypothetical protein
MIFCFSNLNAQVTSQYLPESSSFTENIGYDPNINYEKHILPKVDFAKVLAKDKLEGSNLNRMAVKTSTSFSKHNGDTIVVRDEVIWTLDVKSQNARFLIYKFADTYLPPSARMFIYSPIKEFLQGPITSINITDGIYVSDIIDGNQSQIIIKLKKEDYDNLKISIPKISHGIPEATSRSFGSAASCHYDVNCSLGNGYGVEADAVGFMIENMERFCSGSLINNECSDLTPFFLTAFHCINSPNEVDPSIATFRFNYEATNPSCPGNSSGNNTASYITFSGAQVRSSFADSDFALLELNGSLLNLTNQQKDDIALAGWSRSSSPATSGVGMHHPSGDAKKVSSYILDAVEIDNVGLLGFNGIFHWEIRFDKGKVEKGSSGSPIFDQNNRIVGQLEGGPARCGVESRLAYYGRFNKSWTGGGTNSTRLSNWLGDGSPAMTVNSIRIPYVDNSNDSPICTSNRTVPLINSIPGRSVSWSVSPSSLVAVSSGSGANASIRAKNSSSAGVATLTYTLTKSGCDPITISNTMHIGKPILSSSSMNGQSPVSLVAIAEGSATSYSWTKVTGGGNIYPFNNTCSAYPTSFMVVNASATNVCGSKSIKDFYIQYGGYSLKIVNNPTLDVFHLDVGELLDGSVQIKSIRIQGLDSREVLRRNVQHKDLRKYSFDLSNQKTGTYMIIVETDKGILSEKIVKI